MTRLRCFSILLALACLVALAFALPAYAAPFAQTPAFPAVGTATANANLRGGPGTNYAVVGGVPAGAALSVVGRNAAGDWLRLADGTWIAAFLVDGAPAELPVAAAPALPTAPPAPVVEERAPAVPVQEIPPTATPAPAPSNCDPSYPTLCIPRGIGDLDCGDIGARRFPVTGSDPHRFDGDNDGVGCESG